MERSILGLTEQQRKGPSWRAEPVLTLLHSSGLSREENKEPRPWPAEKPGAEPRKAAQTLNQTWVPSKSDKGVRWNDHCWQGREGTNAPHHHPGPSFGCGEQQPGL